MTWKAKQEIHRPEVRLWFGLLMTVLVIAGYASSMNEAVMKVFGSSAESGQEQSKDLVEADRLEVEVNNLYKEGRPNKALPLAHRLLAIREKALGSEHSDIAYTLNLLGTLYAAKGEYKQAEPFYKRALAIWEKTLGSEHPFIAAALNNLAEVYMKTGEDAKAEQLYQRALAILEKAQDFEGMNVVGIVENLVRFYERNGDFAKAKQILQRGLAIKEKELRSKARDAATSPDNSVTQDKSRAAAEKLSMEAEQLRKQGTPENLRVALKKEDASLPLWRALGDRAAEGQVLYNIGGTYILLNEWQKAISYLLQARQLMQAVGDRAGEADTLNNIAASYASLNKPQEALNYFNQSMHLRKALADQTGEIDALTGIGLCYSLLGEPQKAVDIFNQARQLSRSINDRAREARLLDHIGAANAMVLGKPQEALELLSQALQLRRAAGDRAGEATTLDKIGATYANLGEKQKALEFYNQALRLRQAVNDYSGEALTLDNIGGVYATLGEQQKALDSFNQALLRWQAAKNLTANTQITSRSLVDLIGEALTLTHIGAVYSMLGEPQKGLDYLNQALLLNKTIGNRAGEAATLHLIGMSYSILGEDQKALHFLSQALPLWRAVGSRAEEATTLTSIGTIYSSLEDNLKALYHLTQALEIRKAMNDRVREIHGLNVIGKVYGSLSEQQKALDFFNQALSLSQIIADPYNKALALQGIATVERDRGNLINAREKAETVLKTIESLRAKVVSQELRASFFAPNQGLYQFYIDLLMRLHKQRPSDGHNASALQASERARARSLLESLTEARADIRQGVDPALFARERTVQQRLNQKAEEQLKLLSSSGTEAQIAAVKNEIDALTIELQQVQTQIRQSSPRYAALTQPQPLTPAEMQQQVLDADTLLLEYSLGAERSFLWAVTPTTINSYELPKREVIEAAAQRVYDLLVERSNQVAGETDEQKRARRVKADADYTAAATQLSQMLLGPVAQQLGKKRLVIVADGALHILPFGALPDPNKLNEQAGNWQPLIVEHELVNLPSASTLAVLRRELKDRKPAAKALAVIADPVFTRDDVRVKAGTTTIAAKTADKKAEPSLKDLANEKVTRKLVQKSGGAGDLRISRLPFTREEAERILALVPATEGMKALDFAANRALVESDRLSQYRIVHFATHGLADSERAELSTIVLSLFDEHGKSVDGFLRAHEVFNLNLPAELVVLSACETGLGKQVKGEGLVTLTRGFMYAGAACVVVSLWSVSDKATAELMTKFYRKMLVEGQRPAAALRAAQVEMWKDKQWSAPYYWAAFTLQGEWR